MAAPILGAAWALVVLWLLLRALRQWRVHRTASIGPAPLRRPAPPEVAIILPARNEIANIAGCLAALSRQVGLSGAAAIIVVDDESRDGTAAAVERAAAADPRIRLLRPGPLPEGWMGKPRGCWQGALTAEAEWLCFIDADVRAAPTLVATAVAVAEQRHIDMLSLSPFQELGSFWERLIVPAGLLLLACTLDLRRFADPAAPEISANGQFLLFRREAYFAVGGHEAVRDQVCEDKALALRVKRSGRRFALLGAESLARTRMYTDGAALWEGFSKNAVELLGDVSATVAAATAGLAVAWSALVIPAMEALSLSDQISPGGAVGLGLSLFGSAVMLGVHIGTARHMRIPLVYGLLFPAAYAAVAAIAWRSLGLRRAGRISWKGRTYEIDRHAASPERR
jgi:chlorobactene glucosyltransferase